MTERSEPERLRFEVKPPRLVRYRSNSYLFVAFDVGRVEFVRADGRRGVDFDDDDVFCTLVESMPFGGNSVRVHLQDREMEF